MLSFRTLQKEGGQAGTWLSHLWSSTAFTRGKKGKKLDIFRHHNRGRGSPGTLLQKRKKERKDGV